MLYNLYFVNYQLKFSFHLFLWYNQIPSESVKHIFWVVLMLSNKIGEKFDMAWTGWKSLTEWKNKTDRHFLEIEFTKQIMLSFVSKFIPVFRKLHVSNDTNIPIKFKFNQLYVQLNIQSSFRTITSFFLLISIPFTKKKSYFHLNNN